MMQFFKATNGYLLIREAGGRCTLELCQGSFWLYDNASLPNGSADQIDLPALIPGDLGNWHVSSSPPGTLHVHVVDHEDKDRTICSFSDKLIRVEVGVGHSVSH